MFDAFFKDAAAAQRKLKLFWIAFIWLATTNVITSVNSPLGHLWQYLFLGDSPRVDVPSSYRIFNILPCKSSLGRFHANIWRFWWKWRPWVFVDLLGLAVYFRKYESFWILCITRNSFITSQLPIPWRSLWKHNFLMPSDVYWACEHLFETDFAPISGPLFPRVVFCAVYYKNIWDSKSFPLVRTVLFLSQSSICA